jgi:acetyltransferase-like isoleucine patch superfamily enzyme
LVSAGVTIGANSIIKESALLALGSKIISGIIIGSNSLIAAGAVVVNDIGDNQKVFGLPAKEKHFSTKGQ